MATKPLGGDSVPVTLPGTIPPAPAVMAILNRFNRDELGNAIEVLVALLDIWDGDPDAQDTNDCEDDFAFTGIANAYAEGSGPGCYLTEQGENAWIEWDQMRGSQKRGPNIASENEDDEDDDPDDGHVDEDVPAFDPSDLARANAYADGSGCPIADPGGCEHDGREEEPDTEVEMMPDDVPVLKVFSLDHEPFTDNRRFLGYSNLTTSFVASEALSADTGNILLPSRRSRQPGTPV